jgi:hypothetical protein
LIRILAVWAALFSVTTVAAVPLPPALETAHLLGHGLPSGTPPVPLSDELYALGWSRANAFAVLERRSGTDAPPTARLKVLDLVSDRILFEQEWPDWGPPEARDAWWQEKQADVEAVFRRFDLVPTDRQLGVFPAILDNEFYTLALRAGRSADQAWITRLELVVHSTGRGLKVVGDGQGYWRWATLLGFVPSPFENRVAVILLVQPAGWQGAQQPLRFLVTGLSLKAGFPEP